MQKRGKSSVVRRSGFGDLPKSEKPENKNGKDYRMRREVRCKEGAERHARYEERLEREKRDFLKMCME
jgi:hypothetical protein